MKTIYTPLLAALLLSLPLQAAQIIVNGGFESGFANWTRSEQVGSDGTFALQTGTVSPVNGFAVPSPPQGSQAAMTDSQGPGAHVLYQDFLVPNTLGPWTLSFLLFLNNTTGSYFTPSPASLDFSTPTLNQQLRVDVLKATADPFSVAAADVLQNIYQTQPGNPAVSGYNLITADLSALIAANAGQTVRLRFAEVDNVGILNAGVDAVSLADAPLSGVPEPSTFVAGLAVLGLAAFAKRR
jgi:hypothetical protein